jgi:hypothetical protein
MNIEKISKCCKYSWMSYNPINNQHRFKGKTIVTLEGKHSSRALYLKEGKETFIAFRGTNNKNNMKACMNSNSITTEYGKIHSGFYSQYISLMHDIQGLLNDDDSHDIYFTGHSMGGSIALISSIANLESLRKMKKKVYCYTFGAPCTTDQNFMDYAGENLDCILSIELPNDIIPYVPLNSELVNPSNLVLLPRKGNVHFLDVVKNHSCKAYYKGLSSKYNV